MESTDTVFSLMFIPSFFKDMDTHHETFLYKLQLAFF